MKKWTIGIAIALGVTVGFASSPGRAWAQGVVNYLYPTASTFTISAPSGMIQFQYLGGAWYEISHSAADGA